jgi:hypothetical protein
MNNSWQQFHLPATLGFNRVEIVSELGRQVVFSDF